MAKKKTDKPAIKALASNDDTVIIWKYKNNIPNCWGFSVFRKRKGESDAAAEPLLSSVGFEGDDHKEGEQRPTTLWPLQRFMWTDYFVRQGDEVCYRVVPMISQDNQLVKDEKNATPWSDWIKVHNGDHEVYYNRGLVSSQFVARFMLNLEKNGVSTKLDDELKKVKSPIREFMGGTLVQRIYELLDEVKNNTNLKLYAALYELNDDELIRRLNAIGKRANIILANGAFQADDNDPEAENAKKLTKVTLTRRIVSSGHFAHNKFLVITRKTGTKETPVRVLTGSTNWTLNGLFKQANNAVVLSDKAITLYYFDQWKKIFEDCKDGKGLYAKPFKTFNALVKTNTAKDIRTWFTPTAKLADMNDAIALLNKAKQGIFFLMFKPGNIGKVTLYNEILRIAKANKKLLVHGVINTDPGGNKTPTIEFMHKGAQQPGSFQGVTKGSIKESFEFWTKELGSPAVTIHSKLIVIDPFSANPVIITGSHNMGEKASRSNDDNMNIITKNPEVAAAYAVHIMSVYHHYRWRYYRSAGGAKKWDGNKRHDSWQNWYWNSKPGSNNRKELEFWWG